MSTERVIWGLIPAAIAVSLIALAAWMAATRRTLPQIALSFSIVALSGSALWMLYRILVLNAWPTAIPHLTIGLATALGALQLWTTRRGNG